MHETIYAPDYYILEHHGILGHSTRLFHKMNSIKTVKE